MKKIKSILLGITAFVMCSLYAVKPTEKDKEKFAGTFTDKLSVEVSLTDSQKVQLMKKVLDYSIKMDSVNLLTNDNEKSANRVSLSVLFEQSIDSLLTKEQKIQLQAIREQRLRMIINKYQSKK
jgi:hypothetical protein